MDIAAVREAQTRAAQAIADLDPSERSGHENLALLGSKRAQALMDDEVSEAQHEALKWDWDFWARPDQTWPDDPQVTGLVLASGRSAGKTWMGAQLARRTALERPDSIGLLVAPTPQDARDIMIEGPTGILAVSPAHERPTYEASKLLITWPNGARAHIRTAAEPEAMRGFNAGWGWIDELAKARYPQQAWDNFQLCLRGTDPRWWLTTTPRTIPLLKMLLAGGWPRSVVRRVSTYRNLLNLPESYVAVLLAMYEGTRIGRQELYGEILEDTEGALLNADQIVHAGPGETPTHFDRIVVGVDPSTAGIPAAVPGMGHEAGIIVAGSIGPRAWVLDDRSLHGPPERWGVEMILTALEWEADAIVIEAGFGREQWKPIERIAMSLVRRALAAVDDEGPPPEIAWIVERIRPLGSRAGAAVAIREQRVYRGKKLRAEPIVALHPGRVTYAGSFPLLEGQLTGWVPPENDPEGKGSSYSPDRIDAWSLTLADLLLHGSSPASSSQSSAARIPTGAAAASRGRSSFR